MEHEDQIYTHEKSNAVISFGKGVEVDLMENTLFKIIKEDKTTHLKLEKGLMNARFSEHQRAFQLDVGGNKYTSPKKGLVQLVRKDNKERLTVIEGEINIGDEKKLKKDQYLEIDTNTGNRQVETLQITPLSPLYKEKIYFIKESTVHFRWNGGNNLNLVIGRDNSFENPVFNKRVKGESRKVTNLEEGKYYWKIKSKKMDSGTRIFELIKDAPPVIHLPIQEAVLKTKGKNDYGVLSWSESRGDAWILELQTPEGKKKLELDETKYIIDPLNQGKYSFRVKVENERETPWSDRRNFSVEKNPLPLPPDIISPEDKDYHIVFNVEEENVKLLWNMIPEVSGYHVEVKKDDSMIFDEEVEENKMNIEIEESGEYLWRVRGLDHEERDTQFSKWHRFTFFKVEGGFKYEKIILAHPEEKIPFFWKQEMPLFKGRNILEVSTDSDFKVIKEYKINDQKTGIRFGKDGRFYWRMRMDIRDRIMYSESSFIDINPSPPPDKPDIPDEIRLEILHESSFFNWIFPVAYGDELPFVRLQWEKQEDVKKYIVEIYADRNMKKRIISESVKENSYDFKNPRSRVYYWRYAVEDFWDQKSPFSNLSILKIRHKKGTELLRPVDEEEISPDHSIFFEWKGNHYSKEYLLQISRKSDFKEILWERKIKKTHFVLDKNGIRQPGDYYWRILSFEDEFISAGSSRKFYKKEKNQDIQKNRHLTPLKKKFDLYFAPASTDIKQNLEISSIKMDDIILNSFILKGEWLWDDTFFELLFERRKGKAFNDRDYNFYNAQLLSGYSHKNFKLKLGLVGKSSSIFKANYFEVTEVDTTSQISILGGVEYNHPSLGKGQWKHEILSGFIGMKLFEYNLIFQYPSSEKMTYNGGIRMSNYSFDSNEIEQSDIQFLIGIGREFD